MTNPPNPTEMTPEELESHIQACSDLALQETAAGNPEAALGWMQLEQQAVRARQAPHYFIDQADRDRLALAGRNGHNALIT